MKTVITGKNYAPSEKLKETIEKKFAKLDKYFSDEITANVMTIKEKSRYKVEATINTKGTIFRAETISGDPYDCVDRCIEKLSTQMSKFNEEEQEEINVVRSKKFQLEPMNVEEAIMQMEMLNHDFFVYLNMETDSVNVVYKRKDGNYGVLETTY